MANSTPIDPRQLGRQSAGGFTPIDLQRNWTNTQPQRQSQTPAPTPSPSPSGGSRGERNNNAGNLEDGPFARSQPGYAGSDGRFAKFKTPQDGENAQVNLLRKNYAGMSVAQIIQKYAPLGDNSEASVRNYIGYVASRAGLDPDAKLGDGHYNQVAAAMRAFETGKRGPVKFKPYGGQLTRASSGGSSSSGGGNGRIVVPNSVVPGPSGQMNTGVTVQGQRTFNDGPRLEAQQRVVEGQAVKAGQLLDSYMTQLEQTQNVRVEQLNQQTQTVRAINQQMTDATNQMIQRTEPIFKRRQEILDQAAEIQSMSPIARAVRGFFDLNYDEKFLMNQASKLGQIVAQSEESYKLMQSLHVDAVQNADRLFAINTALPEANLAHLMERTKAQEMILQRSQQNLEIIRGGIQNETLIAGAQKQLKGAMLDQLDLPTKVQLLGQAEQNGGVVNYNGVVLSANELREDAQRAESYEYQLRAQRMGMAAGEAEFADKSAARMVEYASDSKIDQAIANGGVMDGVQIAPGVLTEEKSRRMEAVIQDAQRREIEATPKQVLDDAYSNIAYERQLSAKMSTIFGPHTIDDQSVAYSTEVQRVSQELRAATERGASPIELGLLRNRLAKAREAFNTAVQAKVTRMVGNDEEGAAYIQSYLMNDRPTPQAGAAMLVHFAAKGGLPAAVQSGGFGAAAMGEAINLVERLKTSGGPNGKGMSLEKAQVEAARLIADPTSEEGKRFRNATAGALTKSRFSTLPRLANLNDVMTHPFGGFDYKLFYSLSGQADYYGNSRIAADNGFDISKPDQAAQWEALKAGQIPKGFDPKRGQAIVDQAATIRKQISNEQANRLADLLDQEAPVDPNMRNSQLMLDFLNSSAGATAIEATERGASNGGLVDWMTNSISMGGVSQRLSSYTKTFEATMDQRAASQAKDSLTMAQMYRNDPIRRFGAIASTFGLNRGQITKFAMAMAPLIPQGSQAQQAENANQGASRSSFAPRTSLTQMQVDAIDTIIATHKFDDPEVEDIRKQISRDWKERSEMTNRFYDGLIVRPEPR